MAASNDSSKSKREHLTTFFDGELVIGLVGAVGTELGQVVELLNERLGLAGYKVSTVKISRDVIPTISPTGIDDANHFKRISNLMDAGNAARRKAVEEAKKSNDEAVKRNPESFGNAVLAFGAATAVYAMRTKGSEQPKLMPKNAFIIDSLKRPEEVEQLRLIYPSGFILIGVHAEEDRRQQHLEKNLGMSAEDARMLIDRDSAEQHVDFGQRVNSTFHLADFFVRISENRDRLRSDIQRMVEIWFGNPFLTPTFDEYAMFFAFAAALRSADLSRQVGAVVAKDNQVLATGANDCPRAGGGLYWPERSSDGTKIEDAERGRDYTRSHDPNKIEQRRIIDSILKDAESEMKLNRIDVDVLRQVLEHSRIKDLTEFGRVVHAEMEALFACSRAGIPTIGATLYATTFPCHNCAKHIVAAGLKRVVYIEPYPKSKALEFHDDSICTSSGSPDNKNDFVKFEPFVGIGPRRFFDLFSMHLGSSYDLIRKDPSGMSKEWRIEDCRLRIQMKPCSYLELEAQGVAIFASLNGDDVKKD